MSDKVIKLSELNAISNMDIAKFVQDKYGEGWTLETDLTTSKGSIRIYQDKNGVKYTIEYLRNDYRVMVPYKLLRICNVIVDFND